MNLKEFAVLSGINLAPFHASSTLNYWVSAADIAKAIREDERLVEERTILGRNVSGRTVGYILRTLEKPWPRRSEPLVESKKRRNVKVWKMTKPALSICIA